MTLVRDCDLSARPNLSNRTAVLAAALRIWIPVKKTSTNTDILIAQLRAYEAYEYPYDVKFVEGIFNLLIISIRLAIIMQAKT